ncbi:MAG: NUDIX hydrolase, partial [Myxococcota bacterium]
GETRPLRPLVPILVHDRLVGLAARFGDVVAPWFAPDFRRHGWGDELARGLDQAGLAVAVPPDGPERDWFLERGYLPTGRTVEGCAAIQRLDHPSSQPDRRAAASATLIDPVRRRVLVGQRMVGPWPGYWAFPGGSLDEGEALVDTARRELREETGIEVVGEPVAEREVIVGHSPGYRVTNFTFVVWDEPAPLPTPELEAAWFDWDQARALRPMAAGTRRILREVTDEPHAQIRPPAVFQCLG